MRSNFAQITFVSWQTVLRFMRSVQRQSTRRLLLSLLWWLTPIPFPLSSPCTTSRVLVGGAAAQGLT